MTDEEHYFPLSAISAGVILIILATTYLMHPIPLSVVIDYFRDMEIHRTLLRPPAELLTLVVFFFNALGVWQLVLSGLRIVFQHSVRRALEDVTGAFFSFFTAFLLTNYADKFFTWQTALGYFIMGIGVLVIINGIIHFAFPRRKLF